MEFFIILFLIILNGFYAMAETAIISSRKHKLQQQAQEGDENARRALELAENPNRFLSTTQIGITLTSIFAGAFGGATISAAFAKQLQHIPFLAPYSIPIAFGSVVLGITYFSLVLGEILPKRIALSHPERIAAAVSGFMDFFSHVAIPIVMVLSYSTDALLKLLKIQPQEDTIVSEDEIRMLISEGTKTGVFEQTERNIVERTFRLSDRHVNALMTSRKQIVWLDITGSIDSIRTTITNEVHSYYPVCKGSLDQIVGVVRTEDVLTDYFEEGKMKLQKSLHNPLFVPSNTPVLKVLELFKKSGIHLALVIDEYGMLEGLISITDILEAIVGDIPTVNELEEKEIVKRDRNSWLVDGLVSIDECKDYFQIRKLPGEKTGSYHTLGGFVMYKLGRLPLTGDKIDFDKYTLEIVDMDGNRVDKILVTKKQLAVTHA